MKQLILLPKPLKTLKMLNFTLKINSVVKYLPYLRESMYIVVSPFFPSSVFHMVILESFFLFYEKFNASSGPRLDAKQSKVLSSIIYVR